MGLPGGSSPLKQLAGKPRNNAHVRQTIPYDDNSAVVRDAKLLLQRLRYVRMRQESCPGSGHFAAGRSAVDG